MWLFYNQGCYMEKYDAEGDGDMALMNSFGFEPVKTGERYFISYKTEDTKIVGRIARCLNQKGVPMWYDYYGIEKGKRWEIEITKNIRECKAVILFATKNVFGHEDTYLRMEYKIAKRYNKTVYVVWLERPEVDDIHDDLLSWYFEVDELQGLITTTGEEPDEIAWRMIKEIPLIDGRTPQPPIPIYGKTTGEDDKLGGRPRRTVHAGDEIPFGRYPQGPKGEVEDLIWRVLDIDEKQHRALLITKRLIDGVPYHERYEGITWGNCTLQDWMNGKFMDDAFNEQEKSEIAMVRIDNPDNPIHGINGGKPTEDKVFALSIEEANKYFKDNGDRMAAVSWYLYNKGIYTTSKSNKEYNQYFTIYRLKSGEETGWWWLRSPGITSFEAAHVLPNGDIDEDGHAVNIPGVSVRPALWLKI